MGTYLASALVCIMLWYQHYLTVNSQTSDVCVFGSVPSCFYQCKCQFFNCNPEDPNCKICYDLTGLCVKEEHACKLDNLINDIYVTRYWTGAACQKGNIAAMKLYSVSGAFLNTDPAVGGATDGSLDWYVAFYVTPSLHTAVIYLERTYKIEFIDIFLQSEDLELSQLAENIQAKLVMKNGSFSECIYTENPSNNRRLRTTLVNKERMHFLCNAPSVGYKLEVAMQGTGFDFYEVKVYEIIIIGYRYAEVNANNCLQVEGDGEISWCSKCNNSLPPECQQQCPQSLTGINCNDTIERSTTEPHVTDGMERPTTETNSNDIMVRHTTERYGKLSSEETTVEKQTSAVSTDSETSSVIFIAVGIIVGLLLCLCGTLVVVIFFKHRKTNSAGNLEISKDTEHTYDEEETYDVLDEISVNDSKGNKLEKVVSPVVGFRHSGVPNEYLDISSTGNHRQSLTNDYLSAKSTEPLKNVQTVTDVYIDRKDRESTQKPGTLRDSYLSPSDLDNPTYIDPAFQTNKLDKLQQSTKPTDTMTVNPAKYLDGDYLSTKSTGALKDAKSVTDVYNDRGVQETSGKDDPRDGYLSPKDLDSSTSTGPDIQTNQVHELTQHTEQLRDNTTESKENDDRKGKDISDTCLNQQLSQERRSSLQLLFPTSAVQEIDVNPYLKPKPKECWNNSENQENIVKVQEETNDICTCDTDVTEDTENPYIKSDGSQQPNGGIQNIVDDPYLMPQTGRYSKNVDQNHGQEGQDNLKDTYTSEGSIEDTEDPYLIPQFKDTKFADEALQMKSPVNEVSENSFPTEEVKRMAAPETSDIEKHVDSNSEAEMNGSADHREVDQEKSELEEADARCEHSTTATTCTSKDKRVAPPDDTVRPMSVSW